MYSIIAYLVKDDHYSEVFSYETEDRNVLDGLLWQNRYSFTFDMDKAKNNDLLAIEVLKDGELFYCD